MRNISIPIFYVFCVFCTFVVSSNLETYKFLDTRFAQSSIWTTTETFLATWKNVSMYNSVWLTHLELDIECAMHMRIVDSRNTTDPVADTFTPNKRRASRLALRTVEIANFITGPRLRRATIVIYEPFNWTFWPRAKLAGRPRHCPCRKPMFTADAICAVSSN